MIKYILRRLIIVIPTLIGITVLCYFVSSLAPGGPLDMLTQNDTSITTEQIEQKKIELGLDQPVIVQYIKWAQQLLKGNMGYSYRTSRPVSDMIGERVGPTLILTLASLVISIVMAVPLGILSAVKPYSAWDYISSGFSFFGAATPNFFAGLVVIYLFSVLLSLLPMTGMYGSGGDRNFADLLRHLIMPAFVLSLQQTGSLIRYTRSSMLEVLQDDYVRTARAKGLRENAVIIGHGLRNALIPVVTVLGMSFPFLIGGAVVVERLFSWPGMGSLMVQSINARDYPVIMGVTAVVAVTVLLGNLIVDIIYGILDPRISYA